MSSRPLVLTTLGSIGATFVTYWGEGDEGLWGFFPCITFLISVQMEAQFTKVVTEKGLGETESNESRVLELPGEDGQKSWVQG